MMEDWMKRQSDVVGAMRFPLLALVVFVHQLPNEVPFVDFDATASRIVADSCGSIMYIVGRMAVPLFFIFSGFYYFNRVDAFSWDVYKSKTKKRVRSLFIPYIAWNVLMIVTILAKHWTFARIGLPNKDEALDLSTLSSWAEYLWTGPIDLPLWYLRDLFVLSLISPVFYWLFKYMGKCALSVLLVVYVFVQESFTGLSLVGIFFYGVGAFFAIHKRSVLEYCLKYKRVFLAVFVAFMTWAVFCQGNYLRESLIRIAVGSGAGLFFVLADRMSDSRKAKLISLSPCVFAIYAGHIIYVNGWVKSAVMSVFSFMGDFGGVVSPFIGTPIVLLICILLFKLFVRLSPRAVSFMCGGRING